MGRYRPYGAKELAYVGIFTAAMAVFAQISIPLPFTPVPMTLSLFAVYLSATILPLRGAVLVQAAYLSLGAAGMPVFANFGSGFSTLAGPTGGYIISYAFMAAVVAGLSARIGANAKPPMGEAVRSVAYAAVYLLALAVCYAFGALWMAAVMRAGFAQTLRLAVVPFLPLDVAKVAACAAMAPKLRKAFPARAAGA